MCGGISALRFCVMEKGDQCNQFIVRLDSWNEECYEIIPWELSWVCLNESVRSHRLCGLIVLRKWHVLEIYCIKQFLLSYCFLWCFKISCMLYSLPPLLYFLTSFYLWNKLLPIEEEYSWIWRVAFYYKFFIKNFLKSGHIWIYKKAQEKLLN
jgi:hypothetical protein